MRNIILTLLIATLSLAQASADTRTTRRNLHRTTSSAHTTATDITAAGSTDSITATHYDKALRSTRESIFLTNLHSTTVTQVTLTVTYVDSSGKMLHRREVTLECEIPPSQTRMATFTAWDKQKTFYYKGTRVTPRSPKAIPYDITIEVTSAVLSAPR